MSPPHKAGGNGCCDSNYDCSGDIRVPAKPALPDEPSRRLRFLLLLID
jgi:hypothetical protein